MDFSTLSEYCTRKFEAKNTAFQASKRARIFINHFLNLYNDKSVCSSGFTHHGNLGMLILGCKWDLSLRPEFSLMCRIGYMCKVPGWKWLLGKDWAPVCQVFEIEMGFILHT